RLQNAVQTPPSGLARHAWRGIIPGRLPHSVKPSPEFCSGNSRVVLFVELPFYNTVVLGRSKETLIKCRQKALTTGYTGVHGGRRGLNQNFPNRSAPPIVRPKWTAA